ncbi:hypothetical protein [Methanoregula sp.]|uniref:hypothetical protein n=1 Tax=Methanoregula sp. TaxID=2052170 RepID=UPI002BD20287|nr:hypothetical protein [Methanoregula sp.]HVP96807.1 hypothetical protein [Methanoregula sp.]
MSQLVIETDTIKKGVLYFFAVAGIAIIGCWIGMGFVNYCLNEAAELTTAPAVASATDSASTVASPVQQYPYDMEFTVLSTTSANGHYQVETTTGSILYVPDFATWNSLLPQDTYAATITGIEANGALDAGTVSRASSSPATVSAFPGGLQVSPYPMTVGFTVLSATVNNGNYEVITTAGQVLHIPDYSVWNSLWPQETYSATITGIEPDGSLDVSTVNTGSKIYYPPGTNSVIVGMALPETWTLQDSPHTGTITLYPDGTGSARIDSYPTVPFTYDMAADGTDGTASYRVWSVPFTINPATHVITSYRYPGAELVPLG